MIKEIRLKPKKGLEEIFYHQDCIINFYCNNNIQNFVYPVLIIIIHCVF